MLTFHVKLSEAGVSVLEFLQQKLMHSVSNKEMKRQIESHRCYQNGSIVRIASQKVTAGDLIEWEQVQTKIEKISFDIKRILFEDQHILIYNKPPGIASDAAGIISHLKSHGNFILVHRLDKLTSGVLILAKNRKAEELLKFAFKEKQIKKQYVALVEGVPKNKKGIIENYLGKIGGYEGQTIYGSVKEPYGKYAKTKWILHHAYKKAAFVKCFPETGRTHQLRVHLSEIGHPILGDYQYCKHFSYSTSRMFLHAYQVVFQHPFSKQELNIQAPIPKDFQEMIQSIT